MVSITVEYQISGMAKNQIPGMAEDERGSLVEALMASPNNAPDTTGPDFSVNLIKKLMVVELLDVHPISLYFY